MPSLTPSLVRTLAPFLVGLLGSYIARAGFDVDSDTLTGLLTAGIGYGYYVVARFLETYAGSRWGYILGIPTAPVYGPAETVPDDGYSDFR